MNIIFTTLKRILFWSYDRGTWQYDVLCVLILAFIFLAPNAVFRSKGDTPDHAARTRQVLKRDGDPDRDSGARVSANSAAARPAQPSMTRPPAPVSAASPGR